MRLLPTCQDVSLQISQARDVDGRLSLRARLHLLICSVCRRVLLQVSVIGTAAKNSPQSGPGLSDQAKQRLKRLLQP
jgi:hypothetical protein